jgi:hypothetical protein
MKRLILALMMLAAGTAAHATDSALDAGVPPKGWPNAIYVQNVPLGSGIPMPGLTSGYSKAEYTSGGLYHVPGYLPGQPISLAIPAKVVQLHCAQQAIGWVCGGFSIDPAIARGENILIQPIFQQ